MPGLEVVKDIGNNKTLIKDSGKNTSDAQTKYYIADSTKVDKFIKTKKNLDSMNSLQKLLSGLMAITGGILVGKSLKTMPILGGIISAFAIYGVCDLFDKFIDKKTKQINMKKHNVEELNLSTIA